MGLLTLGPLLGRHYLARYFIHLAGYEALKDYGYMHFWATAWLQENTLQVRNLPLEAEELEQLRNLRSCGGEIVRGQDHGGSYKSCFSGYFSLPK